MVSLPLKIVRFTERPANTDVLCNWLRTEEFELNDFEVERSLDGINFTKAGAIAAASSYTDYTDNFSDAGAAILNTTVLYYRLKSIDKDSRFVYSGIVMIRLSQQACHFSLS